MLQLSLCATVTAQAWESCKCPSRSIHANLGGGFSASRSTLPRAAEARAVQAALGRHLCQPRHRNQQGQPAVASPLRRRCWPRDPSWQRAGIMTRRDHRKSPGALPAAGESRLGVPCCAAHAPASGLRVLRKGWLPPSECLNTRSAIPGSALFPLPPGPHPPISQRCEAQPCRAAMARATWPPSLALLAHIIAQIASGTGTPHSAYRVLSCGELLTAHPHMHSPTALVHAKHFQSVRGPNHAKAEHSIKNRSLSTICRWACPLREIPIFLRHELDVQLIEAVVVVGPAILMAVPASSRHSSRCYKAPLHWMSVSEHGFKVLSLMTQTAASEGSNWFQPATVVLGCTWDFLMTRLRPQVSKTVPWARCIGRSRQ